VPQLVPFYFTGEFVFTFIIITAPCCYNLPYTAYAKRNRTVNLYPPLNSRCYSTDKPAVIAEKIYANVSSDKQQILLENNGKAGIYRFNNLETGKSYIGSGVNLSKRIRQYYSLRFLESEVLKNKSMIYRSIIKYGYSSFSLEILEYCAADKCLEREQYYLDILQPEYNILHLAGSRLGTKHSEETIAKFKQRKHSEETIARLSAAAQGRQHSPETKAKIKNHI
jgi:hypothetical protein